MLKFGLECEFFVKGKKGYVFPKDLGLGYDGFPLVGEVRTKAYDDPFV